MTFDDTLQITGLSPIYLSEDAPHILELSLRAGGREFSGTVLSVPAGAEGTDTGWIALLRDEAGLVVDQTSPGDLLNSIDAAIVTLLGHAIEQSQEERRASERPMNHDAA